jgi:uncharacterized membrane protein
MTNIQFTLLTVALAVLNVAVIAVAHKFGWSPWLWKALMLVTGVVFFVLCWRLRKEG